MAESALEPDFDFDLEQKLLRFARRSKCEKNIAAVFDFFRRGGFEPILIKGWSVARYYPANNPRTLGDLDLCVSPVDYPSALGLLLHNKFAEVDVDLHKGVKYLDSVRFEELFERSELVECGGVRIRVLAPEDQLRVTCVHWLNDGGANLERLWDIYYSIVNRRPGFDWNVCLDAAGKTRRQWVIAAIAIAHRYLNLNVDATPIADEVKNEQSLPAWLIRALEKEWERRDKLIPLHEIDLTSGAAVFAQLKLRFPPNAIAASIQTEAPFDCTPRLRFQLRNMLERFRQMIPRFAAAKSKSAAER